MEVFHLLDPGFLHPAGPADILHSPSRPERFKPWAPSPTTTLGTKPRLLARGQGRTFLQATVYPVTPAARRHHPCPALIHLHRAPANPNLPSNHHLHLEYSPSYLPPTSILGNSHSPSVLVPRPQKPLPRVCTCGHSYGHMVVSPARLRLPRARCRGACRAPAHGGCPGRCTPQPLGSRAPSAGPGALESTAGTRCPVQGPTAGTLDLWKSADAETGGRNSSATCPGDTITEPGDRTQGCPSQAWASPSQCGKDRQGLKRVWVFMAECKTVNGRDLIPTPRVPAPGSTAL